MHLKKKNLQFSFSKTKEYSIEYNDSIDLRDGIINLCNSLKKNKIVVRVFKNETINSLLEQTSKYPKISHDIFYYYILDDVNFLYNINLDSTRFICFYAVNDVPSDLNYKKLPRKSSFRICLDNYLETTDALINFKCYDKDILDSLFIKKC